MITFNAILLSAIPAECPRRHSTEPGALWHPARFDIAHAKPAVSTFALLLVLSAAVLHATWNFWLKRANLPGLSFVWCTSLAVSLMWAPIALALDLDEIRALNTVQWTAIAGSAAIHVGYFLSLQRGYARADLSIVYPVARGTGPLLAAVSAIVFLGNRRRSRPWRVCC
jgi:drug/metabolite transporter (DMT)-like permease